MGASSSGGTRSPHGRDRLRNNSSRSSSIVGVHGWDLCTSCCGSGAGTCHGVLDVGLLMAIVVASHQTSTPRGRVDLLSSRGGRGDVLVVGWNVARTRGTCNCGVLKTADVGGLLVRDDRGMDQVGICGLGAGKARGMILVMLVLMTKKAMMVFVIVLGWDSRSGLAGKTLLTSKTLLTGKTLLTSKALLTSKRVLVSGTVDRVSVGDSSITNSSAGMHRHACCLITIVRTIHGVQSIDGVQTSMVGDRGVDGVGSVASVAWEVVVGSMESRTRLVRVVIKVGLVGVVRPAAELIGELTNLLLNLLHGCGLGGGGGG